MKRLLAFLLALAMSFLVVSCVKPAEDSAIVPGTEGGKVDTAAPVANAPVNELTGATEAMTLKATEVVVNKADPHRGVDHPAAILIENLYDTLVRVDGDGNLIPSLAESWDISEDGMAYTFKLKKGVKFHDGSELLASDVVFSMNRILGLGEGFSYLYSNAVDSTVAVDDYTVQFNLKTVYAPFTSTLMRLAIVNEDLIMANANKAVSTYGKYGDWGYDFLLTNDAGSGPYTIVEWVPSDHILCDKHDDYFMGWEAGAPEALRFIMVEGTNQVATIMTMLASGETDVGLPDMSREDKDILEAVSGVKTGTITTGNIMYLMYNTKKAPTDDIYVRMALNCLLDYATITDQCYLNANRAASVVSMGLAGAVAPDGITYEYNVAKAEEYLKQSKYYNNLADYPIDFTYNSSIAANQKVAMMLQAAATPLGLVVEITEAPWVTITDKAATVESTMNVTAIQVSASYWEAGAVLESRFTTSTQGTWQNTEWLGDSKIDDMLAKAFTLVDDNARFAAYKEIIDYVCAYYSCAPLCENSTSSVYKHDRLSWPAGDHLIDNGTVLAMPMGYQFRFYDWRIRDAM